MTKTESSPEAPADSTASQEANCTYALEEEAVTGYSQQPVFTLNHVPLHQTLFKKTWSSQTSFRGCLLSHPDNPSRYR